jgi:hypothetical protein
MRGQGKTEVGNEQVRDTIIAVVALALVLLTFVAMFAGVPLSGLWVALYDASAPRPLPFWPIALLPLACVAFLWFVFWQAIRLSRPSNKSIPTPQTKDS